MSTWIGLIVETAGRTDFWEIARKHRIEAVTSEVPNYALIDCDVDFTISERLAEAMSRDVGAMALGFLAQTTADGYGLYAFDRGTPTRQLVYSEDSWIEVTGTPQPWERAFFFEEKIDPEFGPDMLWDEMSDQDMARYEAARKLGDASSVLDLMHPSSTAPLHRVCESFGLQGSRPHGRWKKRPLWSRLLG